MECLKLLTKNKNFIKLLINFTFVIGYFNLYGTIVNEYFSLYNLTDSQTSYIIGISNFFGILGSLIISMILDKYKNYRQSFIILNILGIISHLSMTALIELYPDYAFPIFLITWTMCTVSILPIYTCSMDFVVELTYPVGESISGGFILSCTEMSGIFAVYIILKIDSYFRLFNGKLF